MNGSVPAARVADLVMTETADEVLVYDQKSRQIHHLNQTSAVVWRLCDGQRTISELAHGAQAMLGPSVDEETIRFALSKLSDANLLEGRLAAEMRGASQSRRKFLRRAALAGAAVPIIASITAPSAMAGASRSCGVSCGGDNNCNGCCSQCNGDGQTVSITPLNTCYNPGQGGNDPSLTCNSN